MCQDDPTASSDRGEDSRTESEYQGGGEQKQPTETYSEAPRDETGGTADALQRDWQAPTYPTQRLEPTVSGDRGRNCSDCNRFYDDDESDPSVANGA